MDSLEMGQVVESTEPNLRNIKLTLEYDGARYHGWQIQKNAISIQEVITKALVTLTGEEIQLIGASRTDEGVHALGYVANFKTHAKIPSEKFSYAINFLLPKDIQILKSEEVDLDFHARFCAKAKIYRYQIVNAHFQSVFLRRNSFHIRESLDFDAMKKAAEYFHGTHDFKTFMAAGSSAKTTIRTMYASELQRENDLITFIIKGDGFLYNMVRIMAGTLIDVGRGKIPPHEIPSVIISGNRKRAGLTAPPHGLFLDKVLYK